jgi:hypothetical protein
MRRTISKIALIAAMAIPFSTTAFGGEGTAEMNVRGAIAGFDYVMSGDTVSGSINGFGAGGGKVELTKTADGWSGRLGFHRVTTTRSQQTVDDKGTVTTSATFRVMPGGVYRMNGTLKDEKFRLNGYISSSTTDLRIRGGANEKSIYGGNQHVEYSLSNKGDGNFRGHTVAYRLPNRPPDTYSTELNADGDLDPIALSETDQELYFLLYVLPFNLTR